MRILFVLLVLLPVLSFAQINQIDANGLRQGLWEKKQDNGRLLYSGSFKDGKPVGEWKRYHKGGQVKAIINYSENSDTAHTQLFDKYRKKVAEGDYFNKKKTGTWAYYYKGRKISEEQFVNGVKNGVSKQFYETGELMELTEWKNGKKEGKYEAFFKNGDPYMQCKMSNGKRNGLCLVYFKNKRIQLEAAYKNGLRDGEWKFYNEKGELQYKLVYNNGEILNPEVRDSVANAAMKGLEQNKGKFVDPGEFMKDPAGYMEKMGMF